MYTYDDQSSEFPKIEDKADTDIIAVPGGGPDDCTCENFLREVHYEVTLESEKFPIAGSD